MRLLIAAYRLQGAKDHLTEVLPETGRAKGGDTAISPIERKKGGGREASPFFSLDDGSVPSTGQRRPGLPRADPAVLSARWGLASGFGTGPGVPPMLWPLTGGRRPPFTVSGFSSTCPGGRMAYRGGDSGASSCPDRAWSARSRGPRGAVPEELGRLVRLG